MILTVAALLFLGGMALFVLGNVMGYHGIAVIGGVIVFGVGVMALGDGLEVESGEVQTSTNNTTVVETQYSPVNTPQHLSLGFLVSLAGGVLVLRSLNEMGE